LLQGQYYNIALEVIFQPEAFDTVQILNLKLIDYIAIYRQNRR